MSAIGSQMLAMLAVLSTLAPAYAQSQCPTPTSSQYTAAQQAALRGVSVPGVTATLQTDHRDYHVGDPILLQLATENHGCQLAIFPFIAPEADFGVEVIGPDGLTLRPDPLVKAPRFELISFSHEFGTLLPGAVAVSSYWSRTWTDLRTWHYDLREPGSYWISAVRGMSKPEIRTNTVIVTIR